MKPGTKTALIAMLWMLAPPMPAAAADEADEPPEAPPHYTANCIGCHRQMIGENHQLLYTRPDRRARDHAQLTQRVIYCQKSLKLDWNQQEIAEVVQYLNENFYHFAPPRP